MSESKANKQTNSVHARRALAYIVLIILSFLCLIWFYVLFYGSTLTTQIYCFRHFRHSEV